MSLNEYVNALNALDALIDELRRRLEKYEKSTAQFFDGLSIEQWRERALEAEYNLRQETEIRGAYQRACTRRYKKIAELEQTVEENNKFIELQARRLKHAREIVLNVRKACDTVDGGKSLDP
jgi:hypothetical protein